MKGNFYIEYGEYSGAEDCVKWSKKDFDCLENAISFVYHYWNTRTYTSLNQITLIEGDNKYDWEYIKKKINNDFNVEYESCGYDPAEP